MNIVFKQKRCMFTTSSKGTLQIYRKLSFADVDNRVKQIYIFYTTLFIYMLLTAFRSLALISLANQDVQLFDFYIHRQYSIGSIRMLS